MTLHPEYTVVTDISSVTTDNSWGSWQSTGTTLNSEGKDRNLRDTFTLTSSKGSLGSVTISDNGSANNTDYIPLRWNGLNNAIIGIKGTNTETVQDARYAIDEIGEAIKMVSDTRSTFGAQQNRFEHAIRQNNNTAENTQAAESLIRDTDMAKEMVKYSKERILEQAGQAMLTQADRTNEGVLSLLR